MGRIKTALVKRTTLKLMQGQEFSEDFSDNKKILGSTMPSKKIKNKVAGYLARLSRRNNVVKKTA